jgi:hypothetical protein
MSNSNKSKKNNSIGSILGLNKLRNTTSKLGSSIESGLKSAKNSVTGSVTKTTDSIMPTFVPDTSSQQNTKNNKNNSVSLGNLLLGNNKKNNKKNNNKSNNNKSNNNNIDSLMNNGTSMANSKNESNNSANEASTVTGDLKATATKVSGFVLGMQWFKYFLLFIILLFFGINIFSYLAKTSTFFANITESFFKPIAELFGFSLTRTVEKVVDTSAEGAKYGIDLTKDAIDDVLTLGQNEKGSISNKSKDKKKTKSNNDDNNDDNSEPTETGYIGELEQDITPSDNENADPSETNSAISYGGKKKGSYCYVGVDRGYRSCVKISDGEKCMSGKVFPSKELCVNPSLRA